jgi:hypothetical protein
MARIHKTLKKIHPLYYADKDTFDSLHPYGTQAEAAYDSAKQSEKDLKEMEANPSKDVIPLPNEEDIQRAERRKAARRAKAARDSTIYASGEGFGG